MFKRISSLVNPYAAKLFEYPDVIYPCFEFEKDKQNFVNRIKNENRKIYFEYGSGSGGHLLDLAEAQPDALCIGFEIRFKRAVRTIEKGHQRNLQNVIIFRNKGEFAAELLPERSVSGVFINFPDPWDKKRWLKHRVLTLKVINSYAPLLKANGFISIKTDHREYFSDFIEDLKDLNSELTGLKIEEIYKNLPSISSYGEELQKEKLIKNFAHLESEFEKLFRNQNKEIGYCLLRKE